MFLPEEIWNQVKAFLLLKPNQVLFEKIAEFQVDRGYVGLELKYHLYYHLLKTDRNDIIEKRLSVDHAAWSILKDDRRTNLVDFCFENHYYGDGDDIWNMFNRESNLAYNSIKAIRLGQKFWNVCETAPIPDLLVMLEEVAPLKISYWYHIRDYINSRFNKLLGKTRRYTWKAKYSRHLLVKKLK